MNNNVLHLLFFYVPTVSAPDLDENNLSQRYTFSIPVVETVVVKDFTRRLKVSPQQHDTYVKVMCDKCIIHCGYLSFFAEFTTDDCNTITLLSNTDILVHGLIYYMKTSPETYSITGGFLVFSTHTSRNRVYS